jgi:mono/diheme cytochrome c family protein
MSYSLRDLPLPAKVVVSVFLMAVGLGYTSAMVQLHFQDSKSGKPMPTVADVILKYTGKKWFETDPPAPVSKLERLVMGDTSADAVFNGTGSMAPAFFSKDPTTGAKKYANLIKATPDKKAEIDARRDGERHVVRAWLNAPPDARRAAYEADNFVPPEGQAPKAIDPDWKGEGGYKVKSILDARCVACHGKGGPQESFPLETYAQLEKYMTVPAVATVPPGGGWVRVEEPMSMDKLTQTTHTHLLSFAMLFSLTGLAFAFSSYPKAARLILAPWVTLAVVADVSLWWLARLSEEWGPYFAMGIIGTGGAAGMGLAGQIVLSLFSMYGARGKAVLVGLFLLGGAAGGLVFLNKIQPALIEKERVLNESKDKPVAPPTEDVKTKADGKKPADKEPDKKPDDQKAGPVEAKATRLDRVLMWPVKIDGKDVAPTELPFKKDKDGGMVRAFFDRDEGGEFKSAMKDKELPQAEKDALAAKRHGELAAVRAWIKTAEPQRKAAYDADAFDPPAEWKGRLVTPEYLADGKVKVRSIVTDRCVRCHQDGGERAETPLDGYEKWLKEFGPAPAGDGKGAAAPPVAQPVPVPVKAVDPIPPARDD